MAEVGAGRLLPWLPVAFGLGIAIYFTADREPAWWAGSALRCAARRRRCRAAAADRISAGAWRRRRGGGICRRDLQDRPDRASGPCSARPGMSQVAGFVEVREERERTDRIVVRVHQLEGARASSEKPERVRVSVRKGTAPPVGAFVTFKARLSPPLAPLRPGGYDFARDLYFQGIGASGFVLGAIKVRSAADRRRAVAALRRRRSTACATAIDARIRAVVPGDTRRDRLGADHRQARRDLRRRSTTRCTSRASPTCCRSPAITWRWWRASCSSCCARCSR